jgi:hypothetical protein
LIFEFARRGKVHPAAVFALFFACRRPARRVASVADAVAVRVCLVGVWRHWAIVSRIGNAIAIAFAARHAINGQLIQTGYPSGRAERINRLNIVENQSGCLVNSSLI